MSNKKILLTYFIFLFSGYVFFLCLHLNEFPYKYVFSDLLINYEGGFIRRGLLGQIIYKISLSTNIDIKKILLIFQILPYLLYLYLILNFFSKIRFNFFWLLIFFSTISFIYPLYELEALGRKDIYVILFYLIFVSINYSNSFNLLLIFLIIFTLSSFIHEISIFYLPFYFLVFYLKIRLQINNNFNFKNFILIILFLIILIYLNLFHSEKANIQQILNSYKILGINLNPSGAFSWLYKPFEEHLINIFNNLTFVAILRYLYFLFINFYVIIYFIKLNKNLIIIKRKIDIKLIFLFLICSTFPLYLLALDWGRITYLTFNFFIVFLIYLFQNNLIDLDYLNHKINELSFKIKSIIFFFVCILFSPKLLISDDLSGLPIYKILLKIVKSSKIIFFE